MKKKLYKTIPHRCPRTGENIQYLYTEKDKKTFEGGSAICPHCFLNIKIEFESL